MSFANKTKNSYVLHVGLMRVMDVMIKTSANLPGVQTPDLMHVQAKSLPTDTMVFSQKKQH